MKNLKTLIVWLSVIPAMGVATTALGLSVQVGNKQLDAAGAVSGCMNVEGDYKGFRIASTEPGTIAKICASSGRRNSLRFQDVTIISTGASTAPGMIRLEHDFPAGPKGLVYATVQLHGFFAQATGAGTPTGSRVA